MEATTSTFINRKTSATCFHKHLLHVTTFCDSEETEQLFLFWTVQPVCGTATKISRLARHCACVAGRATHRFNMSSCPSCPFCDPLSKRLQAALSALFTSHAPKRRYQSSKPLCWDSIRTPTLPPRCTERRWRSGGAPHLHQSYPVVQQLAAPMDRQDANVCPTAKIGCCHGTKQPRNQQCFAR